MLRSAMTGVIGLVWLAVLGAQQPSSQPVQRFKTGVDAIAIDASVLDAERRPVRGLTADDFTVLENGRPQPIKTFTAIDLPDVVEDAPVGWLRDVRPDISRNDTLTKGRIVVFVLDDSTPMPAEEVPRAKMMARRAVERLGPDDLAAVVFTFNKRAGQELTTDRRRLLAAVERFNGGADKQIALGAFNPDPLQQKASSLAFDQYDATALQLYSSVVTTLRTLTEYLVDLPERRKALIFVSVGLPLDVEAAKPTLISSETTGTNDMAGGAQSLFNGLQRAFAAAQRANVNIYSLDPGGLRPVMGRYDAVAGTGDLAASPGKLNSDFLHAVANNTGGFTIGDTNAVDQGITQIFRENGSYYLLGYEPSGPRVPGRFRRIEVRVNRPGVTVRARSGYYEAGAEKADREKAAPALEKALSSVVPTADLALQMSAAPFALEGRKEAAVAIALAVRQTVPQSTERIVDELAARVNAYDEGGKQRASDGLTSRVVLRAGSGGEVVFELLSRVELAPGHYQLRVAADSSIERKSGSVYYELDVPDFQRNPLSLSGVVLNATPGATAARKDAIASLLPLVPTSLRGFDRDQRVIAFLRVYEGGSDAIRRVQIAARIRDAADEVVFEQTADLTADRFTSGRAADYQVDLPIAQLKPGAHLLTIEARTGDKVERRDVRFAVR